MNSIKLFIRCSLIQKHTKKIDKKLNENWSSHEFHKTGALNTNIN